MNIIFNSELEFSEKLKSLEEAGYYITNCDLCDKCVKAFFADKVDGYETKYIADNYILYLWPVFGKELIPEISIVSPNELLEFISNNEVYSCDDPVALQIGFVKYIPDEGKSIVKRVRLSDVRAYDNKDHLLEIRNNIKIKRFSKI